MNISTNAIEARHFWDSLSRDQLPFGISRAINGLTFDIRDRELEKTDRYFEIRTRRMQSKYAMPAIPSHKKQFPNIHGVIGVRDEVAALNVTGGVRRPAGSDDMAVPFSDAGNSISARSILNPGRETLPKSKWPSNIVKANKRTAQRRRGGRALKPKPFYLKAKSGRRFVALRSSASSLPLTFLYEFKKQAYVKATWPLVPNAEAYVSANYDDYLTRALDRAVSSMRV